MTSDFHAFDVYQTQADSTAMFPKHLGMSYPAMGLGGEAGEVLEIVKKVYRDSNGELSDEKRQALKKELGDVLWYVAVLALEVDIKLSDIAKTNLDKLASRQARGKLHGSGDDR